MNSIMNNPDDFRRHLRASGADYLRLSDDADTNVAIRFIGTLNGKEVIWDAKLHPLGKNSTTSQYIRIVESDGPLTPIEIGLAVDQFNSANIKKTIIMIRNYRHLHAGEHLWQAH